MWQKHLPGPRFIWEDALAYAENLSLAGYDDWRLPTIKELRSIVDYNRSSPVIDIFYFPEEPDKFWSSTTVANGSASAWYLNSTDEPVVIGATLFTNFLDRRNWLPELVPMLKIRSSVLPKFLISVSTTYSIAVFLDKKIRGQIYD
jgi:hypothetical protein